MQLAWLGDAIVIRINPEQELRIYGVAFVDNPIAVAAIFRLVELGERQVSMRRG
ncbi:MAG: hypothetical protein WBX38_00490 [Candidatus Sulfotelmatobacter sp.]